MILGFDVETCSEVDLAKAGAWAYAAHPSTRVLCVAWGDAKAQQVWQPGEHVPIFAADTIFEGYNVVGFDALIWYFILGPKFGWTFPGWQAFRCTMARAAYTNLPGTLGQVAHALGCTPKDAAGHALMLKLCKPSAPIKASNDPWRLHTPEALARLAEYCKQDVAAEQDVSSRLPHLTPREAQVFEADRAVNERGVFLDVPLVKACRECAEGVVDHYRERLSHLTHGSVTKESDLNGIMAFCNANGLKIEAGKGAMDKEALEKYLDLPDVAENVKEVLSIRQLLGRSSLAKFKRMMIAKGVDNRLRGMLEYYGAHQTGRWGGRIIQPQNLPRAKLTDYDLGIKAAHEGPDAFYFYYGTDALSVLTQLIRPCLRAQPGYELVTGDYNAIECRVLAWLAGEKPILDAFHNGRCPYKTMAAVVFKIPYEQVTKDQRQLGKVIILACGYGMGAEKFKDTAFKQYGVALTAERAKELVDLYRATNAHIVKYWYAVGDAMKDAIDKPGQHIPAGKLVFKFDGVDLKMRMPNGVVLWYRRAFIAPRPMPKTGELRPAVHFYGEDIHGNWSISTTYGGKAVENCCQALSRGLTADALVRCESRGLRPVLTVHDEIVCETPIGSLAPQALEKTMCESEPWSAGIPVKAEAFASPYYRK